MFKLEFSVNGRKVPLNRMAEEMEKAMSNGVSKQVAEKLARVRCPVHGQTPRVEPKGQSLSDLSFNLKTCCDELMERAKAVLGATE